MVGMKGRSGGHNRKPDSLKALEGNIGHQAKPPDNERDPDDDITPFAQRYTEELHELKMKLENPYPEGTTRHLLWQKLSLSAGGPDVNISRFEALLEAAVEVWQEHRELREQIRDEGRMITDRDGVRRKHPLLSACNSSLQNLLKVMTALGLTPDAAEIVYDMDARPINWFGEVMRMDRIEKEGFDPDTENRLRAIEARKRREKDQLQ